MSLIIALSKGPSGQARSFPWKRKHKRLPKRRALLNEDVQSVVNKFSDWIFRARTERSYHTSR
jgi:hypothetical protein